jgi:hypothetical protein
LKYYFLTDYYEEPKSFLPTFCSNIFKKNKRTKKSDKFNNRPNKEEDFQVLNSLNLNTDHQINMDFDIQDLTFNETSNDPVQDKPIKTIDRPSKLTIYTKRYTSFITSPKVHFFYDTFFYIIFLLLFR